MAEKLEMSAADAAYLVDALRSVTNPVIINVGEIATQKNVKVNTVQKRLSDIKKRYNLNIQTTAVGSSGASPSPAKARAARTTKTPAPPKKAAAKKTNAAKVAAIAEQLEEESDEGSVKVATVKNEDGDEEMGIADKTEEAMYGDVTDEDSDRV